MTFVARRTCGSGEHVDVGIRRRGPCPRLILPGHPRRVAPSLAMNDQKTIDMIRTLLEARSASASICPSDVTRALAAVLMPSLGYPTASSPVRGLR